MNAQEQTLIENLFQQLRQLDGQPKDGQAEAWVRQQAQQTPDALYWLTQRGLLLEQALQQAQQQEAQLQAQLVEARAAAAKPSGGSSSFLGAGLDTHFGRSPDANLASRSPAGYAPSYPPNSAAPAGYGDTPAPASTGRWFGAAPAAATPAAPAPMPAQPSAGSAAGGFLGQAAASAAGVAGGMLLFNGLSHLWSNPAQAASNPTQAASDTSKAASNTDTAAASSDNSGLDQLAQQAGRDHVDPSANRWMPDADNNSNSSSQDVADYDSADDGFDFLDDDQA